MSAIARSVLVKVSTLTIIFAAGLFSGVYLLPHLIADSSPNDHDHADHDHESADHASHDPAEDHDHDHEEEGPHIALSKQAFSNLDLQLGRVTLQDYWKSQSVPGEVVEIHGTSTLTVSSPVNGVVDSIAIRPGEAVRTTQRLFSLRITDDVLAQAQSKLLAGIARQNIIRREVARLAPLTASGAIAGRKQRDLEYELAQLAAGQRVLQQEMRSRGLPDSAISGIATGGLLANSLDVSAANAQQSATIATGNSIRPISYNSLIEEDPEFAVEQLMVQPGQTVTRGQEMCTLSNHAELYVRGHAYEGDLSLLHQLSEKGWGVSIEFGHDHDSTSSATTVRENLPLLRIENEVQPDSQTLAFFLPLQNERLAPTRDQADRSFVHWRFKPGQRVHLRLPVEKWEQQIVLPLDAIVLEGPNVIAFVEHHHPHHEDEADHHDSAEDADDDPDHAESDDHDHDHNVAGSIELEPVAVRLLHRDDRVAVIANDGQLHEGELIALNAAYKLHQAMKMQAGGGGGGHDHGHEH